MDIAQDLADTAGLLARYPGIEGFHFLVPGTGLVFLDRAQPQPVTEVLDPGELVTDPRADPREGQLLLAALRLQLIRIERAMRAGPPSAGLELGYLLPAGDSNRWHTATFCQHPWLIAALGKDLDDEFRAGTRDPFHTDPDSGLLEASRSVVRGLDELMDHRGAFGAHPYFPAFVRTVPVSGEEAELRVVNLCWSPPLEAGEPVRPDLAPVFECLGRRLVERGTVDRKRRIENRFELVD